MMSAPPPVTDMEVARYNVREGAHTAAEATIRPLFTRISAAEQQAERL